MTSKQTAYIHGIARQGEALAVAAVAVSVGVKENDMVTFASGDDELARLAGPEMFGVRHAVLIHEGRFPVPSFPLLSRRFNLRLPRRRATA